jgi:Ca-activated chloride channel family protein
MPLQTDAADSPDSGWQADTWANLWKTRDQQGAELLAQGKSAEAAKAFDNTQWQSIANYRNENYEAVINGLSGSQKIIDLYNKANALAFKGDLEKSLKVYEQVLQKSPDHEDAAFNKNLIEQLMQQQSNDESQQDQDQQSPQDESDQQQEGDSQNQSDQQQDSESNSQQDKAGDQSSEEQQGDSDSDSKQNPDRSENSEKEQEQEDGQADEQRDQAATQDEEQGDEEQDKSTNQQQDDSDPQGQDDEQSAGAMQDGPAELDDSSEQWLRGIPDDPSGLLRRKFEYQTQQRALQKRSGKVSDNASQEPRY